MGGEAGARDQQRPGAGTGLPKGNGVPCLGAEGRKVHRSFGKEGSGDICGGGGGVLLLFCLVTCGGFFPFQFKSQYLKAPSYLHLAALCKQLINTDLFGIMGIFSALICNKNNLNIKEFTTTLRLYAMTGKYRVLKAF